MTKAHQHTETKIKIQKKPENTIIIQFKYSNSI